MDLDQTQRVFRALYRRLDLANRTIAPDPEYHVIPSTTTRIACRYECGNTLTIADNFGVCGECRRSGTYR